MMMSFSLYFFSARYTRCHDGTLRCLLRVCRRGFIALRDGDDAARYAAKDTRVIADVTYKAPML